MAAAKSHIPHNQRPCVPPIVHCERRKDPLVTYDRLKPDLFSPDDAEKRLNLLNIKFVELPARTNTTPSSLFPLPAPPAIQETLPSLSDYRQNISMYREEYFDIGVFLQKQT